MKDFIKFTLATIVGIVLATIILSILGILTLSGFLAASSSETSVRDNSVFVLNLSGIIEERTEDNPFDAFLNEEQQSLGLDDIMSSIQKAKEDAKIKGIYIESGLTVSAAPATLQQIRAALVDFKSSGKFVVAYGDMFSQGGYYVCSAADKVILNPQGKLDWHGLSSEIMFYKKALEKLGVQMQVYKVGTYKSAVEPFLGDCMSDANREQVTSYLTSIWNQMLNEVSQSRNISTEQLNENANRFLLFSQADEILACGMVDTLLYKDGVKSYLKTLVGIDEDRSLTTLSLEDMINVNINQPKDNSGNIIAVYYAYGEIDNTSSFALEEGINSEKVIKDLSELRTDNNVKAVIFRVNSPGGSAFGSELIWREISLLSEVKPVIVSMGDYAASGGYYISCAADSIFAEPTTLTGSIGIFGLVPDVSKLLTEKIGIQMDGVKTNKFGDFGRLDRGLNAEEGALMQAYINNGYELFVKRCADGRGMTVDAIKNIAEGRVWTGEQAVGLGLVDALGSLDDAVAAGAAKAGIESYTLQTYPEKEGIFASLLNKEKNSYINGQVKELLGDYYQGYGLLRHIDEVDRIQALIPYTINIH